MTWRVGDFGRFLSEDPSRPRFEVIQRVGGNIEVWYGGTTRTTLIPLDTFREDCTQLWSWQKVLVPRWVKPGVSFMLHSHTQLLQAMVQRVTHRGRHREAHCVDLNGQDLKVRRIQRDYVSCLAGPMFVLVPVQEIQQFGYRSLTALDRLIQDEDILDDDLSDLFG